MKKLVIPQKMSNSGSIHDIESDMYAREIKFRKGCHFAVVLSSFYGDHYTTHQTLTAAAKMSRKMKEWSHVVINSEGEEINA